MFESPVLIFKQVVLLLVFLEMVDLRFEMSNDNILLVCFDSHVRDNLGDAHVSL